MTREEQIQRESEVYAWTANQFDVELAFKEGARWADKTMVEKACEWLENINTDDYMDSGIFQMYDMIQDFRKVMEE